MKAHLFAISVLFLHFGLHAEVRYTVVPIYPPVGIDPRSFGTSIGSLGINDNGDVVGDFGYYLDPAEQRYVRRAFMFTHGSNAVELVWEGRVVTYAVGINDSRQVAAYGSIVQPVEFEASRFTSGVGFESLGNFGGPSIEADAINEAGQVTGFSEGPDGRSYAFRYTDGVGLENIGTNFSVTSRGFAINDQGWVAGYGDGYAFLYRDDQGVKNLEPGRAYGVNNKGSVVGVSWRDVMDLGFIYRNGKVTVVGPTEFTPPYWIPYTVLSDINNGDVAVGSGAWEDEKTSAMKTRALIWSESEGLRELRSFVQEDSGWWLTTAAAINDHGQIVGSGVFDGQFLAYRLDPIPPKLHMQHSPTNLLVSWSPNWPGVVLESAASLSAQDWQPVDTGGTNVLTVSATNTMGFFRLNLDALRGLCCGTE